MDPTRILRKLGKSDMDKPASFVIEQIVPIQNSRHMGDHRHAEKRDSLAELIRWMHGLFLSIGAGRPIDTGSGGGSNPAAVDGVS